MLPCIYDYKQHELLDTEIARWCNRNAPADWKGRLFTYRHSITENFVIAVWAGDKYGLFSDVLNLGPSLGSFDKCKADELMRRMWKPLSASDMSDTLRQTERDYNSRQEEKDNEMREVIERRKSLWK